MRVLEWMNNKLLQSSVEPFKGFGLRSSCLCLPAQTLIDDEDLDSGGFKKHREQSIADENCHYSYYESSIFKDYFEDEAFPPAEYFNGFLTIGTLGSEAPLSGTETPTFAIAFENTSKSPMAEVTEEELKLANYKLEKFLEAESRDDWCDESSSRTSFVSAITFTGKQIEGDEEEANEKAAICPLQGYLFGSSVELQEKAIGMKKENTAIEEKLVKQSKMSTILRMKKMLKKINGSFNPQRSESSKAADSKSTKKKLVKVLQTFHKKINPESSPPGEKSCLKEVFRHENKIKFAEFPNQISKLESKMNLPQNDMNSRNSAAKDGLWIKTDADYLVLELKGEGI